jgi:hypothetical protein
MVGKNSEVAVVLRTSCVEKVQWPFVCCSIQEGCPAFSTEFVTTVHLKNVRFSHILIANSTNTLIGGVTWIDEAANLCKLSDQTFPTFFASEIHGECLRVD